MEMHAGHPSDEAVVSEEGGSSLRDEPSEEELIRQGWLPPSRVEELVATIGLIADGAYLDVPKDDDVLGKALRGLARTIGQQGSRGLRRAVDLSLTVNENVVLTVEMSRDIKKITDRSQAIAAAAEELVASVDEISNNTKNVAQDAEGALKEAEKGRHSADQAIDTMGAISGAVEDAAQKVSTLGEAAEDIGHIVTTIEEIAFHTNMIALNAAVEAARAGEAGKGFMVVADEVKRLAQQTKEATVDISSRINTLREDMQTIVSSMKGVAKVVGEGREAIELTGTNVQSISQRVESVSSRIGEVADILSQQNSASSEVAQGITVIAAGVDDVWSRVDSILDRLDAAEAMNTQTLDELAKMKLPNLVVQIAKSDHIKWKKNVASMLVGRVNLDEHSLADHTECRLGKWYDAVTESHILDSPAYRDILPPHRDVHAAGKEAARLYAAGDIDGAVAALGKLSSASESVLGFLNELARGGGRPPASG